jgi:hypothetical protein
MRIVKVKYRDSKTGIILVVEGVFHQWGTSVKGCGEGDGNYTIGIVELENGKIIEPLPENVQFIDK